MAAHLSLAASLSAKDAAWSPITNAAIGDAVTVGRHSIAEALGTEPDSRISRKHFEVQLVKAPAEGLNIIVKQLSANPSELRGNDRQLTMSKGKIQELPVPENVADGSVVCEWTIGQHVRVRACWHEPTSRLTGRVRSRASSSLGGSLGQTPGSAPSVELPEHVTPPSKSQRLDTGASAPSEVRSRVAFKEGAGLEQAIGDELDADFDAQQAEAAAAATGGQGASTIPASDAAQPPASPLEPARAPAANEADHLVIAMPLLGGDRGARLAPDLAKAIVEETLAGFLRAVDRARGTGALPASPIDPFPAPASGSLARERPGTAVALRRETTVHLLLWTMGRDRFEPEAAVLRQLRSAMDKCRRGVFPLRCTAASLDEPEGDNGDVEDEATADGNAHRFVPGLLAVHRGELCAKKAGDDSVALVPPVDGVVDDDSASPLWSGALWNDAVPLEKAAESGDRSRAPTQTSGMAAVVVACTWANPRQGPGRDAERLWTLAPPGAAEAAQLGLDSARLAAAAADEAAVKRAAAAAAGGREWTAADAAAAATVSLATSCAAVPVLSAPGREAALLRGEFETPGGSRMSDCQLWSAHRVGVVTAAVSPTAHPARRDSMAGLPPSTQLATVGRAVQGAVAASLGSSVLLVGRPVTGGEAEAAAQPTPASSPASVAASKSPVSTDLQASRSVWAHEEAMLLGSHAALHRRMAAGSLGPTTPKAVVEPESVPGAADSSQAQQQPQVAAGAAASPAPSGGTAAAAAAPVAAMRGGPSAPPPAGAASQAGGTFLLQDGQRIPPQRRGAELSFHTGLFPYLQEPNNERFMRDGTAVYQDADCLVVHDAFPKARVHLLLIPRPGVLERPAGDDLWDAADGRHFPQAGRQVMTPGDLRALHLPVLRRLHATAGRVADRVSGALDGFSCGEVQLGYHAVPSMRPLHLHIVSSDFDSPFLKTKKHYKSFASRFFLPADRVELSLEENGRLALSKPTLEAMLKGPMKCVRCGQFHRNMPLLKACLSEA